MAAQASRELELTSPPTTLRQLQSLVRGLEEGLRALDLHCLEFLGPKTQQLQDGWGDLRCLYRRRDIQAAGRSGPGHQDRNVSILRVITTVFRDLTRMTGINNSVLSDTDHVRDSGITLRDPN